MRFPSWAAVEWHGRLWKLEGYQRLRFSRRLEASDPEELAKPLWPDTYYIELQSPVSMVIPSVESLFLCAEERSAPAFVVTGDTPMDFVVKANEPEQRTRLVSGLFINMEIHVDAEGVTDFPAMGAAVRDLQREGWGLERYERRGAEIVAVLGRHWEIAGPRPSGSPVEASLSDQERP